MNISDCKPDLHIYYRQQHNYGYTWETFPGVVLRVGRKRARIRYNGLDGDREAWVSPANLELQEVGE